MKRTLEMTMAVFVVTGCNSIIGIEPVERDTVSIGTDAGHDASVPGQDAAACPPSTETNTCWRCTDEKCCVQYEACSADARCGQYYKQCIPLCRQNGKTYPECVLECDAQNKAGHTLFAPYNACVELHCLAECGPTDGGTDPCLTCMYSQCRDAIHACTSDAECDTLQACMTLCQGQPDYDTCAADCRSGVNGASVQKFDLRNTCSLTYCQDACDSW